MSPIMLYLVALIMGLVGGAIHQLHNDKENNKQAFVRAIIMGAVAGVLFHAVFPTQTLNNLIVYSFVAGWFGDNVIMNIIAKNQKTVPDL